MIKYLIVENERLAYLELKRMMEKLRPDFILMDRTETVVQSVEFLQNNKPDLILLDISLSDGSCFEIFNHVIINIPIIFTTAYDEYAIQAFKHNSVDYLLKPIDEEDLSRALSKFEDMHLNKTNLVYDYKQLEKLVSKRTKNRFLIQATDAYKYIETKDIAFFYSEEKVVFLHTFDNKRYLINYTLDQLENQMNSTSFFRVSRNCIANIRAINSIHKASNSRLSIELEPRCPHEVVVSRVRVSDFLKWIDDSDE